MNQNTEDNKLEAQLNIVRFPLNATKSVQLDKSTPWVEKLLKELNEKADSKSVEAYLAETNLDIQLEVTKKFSQPIGEYILLKGSLESRFTTQCVRTLQDMPDSVELDLKAAFIDVSHQDSETYSDQVEVFLDNDLYELYYHKKGIADVYGMIHEQIYLNIEPYPTLDSESSLDWANSTTSTKQ